MSNEQQKLLVTIALPYANGDLHLGHMVEAVQADIWVRFQKQQGKNCLFICGNDAHGTAVMLSAEKHNITPEQWVEQIYQSHTDDFKQFNIEFDNFYTTHSPENQQLSAEIYQRLKANGDITTRTISQAYDPKKEIFLADRFIKGTCPRCGEDDQYGDSCEKCGATYGPMDLKNPRSTITGATPIEKESEHYFFQLANYTDMLKNWLDTHHLQEHVVNKLKEWFEQGLRDWDISRDAPYFGFEIPNAPGKYFYVWLDAPIGYLASLKHYAASHPEVQFEDYWSEESNAEVYHFIGKDIVYFHALFWPAMLSGAKLRTPTGIFAHGFLTIDGYKMSKSRGTFITAKQYLSQLPAEYLRYYFAAKLTSQVEDIDLSLEDFAARINSDLVGKYVNLASRCTGFITKKFAGKLANALPDAELYQEFVDAGESIAECYQTLEYNRAMREVMALADRANQYIDHHKPWALAKEPGNEDQVQAICTQGLNLFKCLTHYLKPVLPVTAAKVEAFLNCAPLAWDDRKQPLLDHAINKFKPLMQRITEEDLAALTEK